MSDLIAALAFLAALACYVARGLMWDWSSISRVSTPRPARWPSTAPRPAASPAPSGGPGRSGAPSP